LRGGEFIVTGVKAVAEIRNYMGIEIATPKEFLERIKNQGSA
jgi:hypothetical protein